MTDHPGAQAPAGGGGGDSRAEQVLSQALRVMAGGGQAPLPLPQPLPPQERSSRRRLTTSQLILLAAIVGLLVGIAAGFISLML